jgi:hypothetical protein
MFGAFGKIYAKENRIWMISIICLQKNKTKKKQKNKTKQNKTKTKKKTNKQITCIYTLRCYNNPQHAVWVYDWQRPSV